MLVTEGGQGQSRAAAAATRILATAGRPVTVTVTNRLSLAGSSRFCSRTVRAPLVDADPEGYAAAVRQELSAHPYVAAFPATDAAVLALGTPIAHLMNKGTAAEHIRAAGLAVPPTRAVDSPADLRRTLQQTDLPVVVKPDLKRTLARRIDDRSQLASLDPGTFPLLVQPYLDDELRGVLGVMWRGRLVSAAHLRYLRVWPYPCGTIAAAVTAAPDTALEEGLERLLSEYEGVFHIDLAGDHVLDINPRIHASLPAAVEAGVDLVGTYCGLLQGDEPVPARARPNVLFRWLEGDLRSLLSSVRGGALTPVEALRAARPRRGTVHSLGSLTDPGPAIARLAFGVRRRVTDRHDRHPSCAPEAPAP